MMNNVMIMSLPRSGSTWLSRRICDAYRMSLINEPFRMYFGRPGTGPMYHARVIGADALSSPDFWKGFSSYSVEKPERFFEWVNEREDLLIKETTCHFQIPFIQAAMPETKLVFLKRNLGAVLDSHIRIPKLWKVWHYDQRIRTTRSMVPDIYREIYRRAGRKPLRGNNTWAQLLAHLAVEALECMDKIHAVIEYESLATGCSTDGLPRDIFPEPPCQGSQLQSSFTDGYSTYGINNPPNVSEWRKNYSASDMKVVRYILGDWTETLFPDISEARHKIPKITTRPAKKEGAFRFDFVDMIVYKTVCSRHPDIRLSNRTITQLELARMLNLFYFKGIEDIAERLCCQEQHEILMDRRIKWRGFLQNNPFEPVNFVSPLAALTWCRLVGGTLPSEKAYDLLAESFPEPPLPEEDLIFASISKRPEEHGRRQIPLPGFYDIFGNIREMCLAENGSVRIVGGSYLDEISQLDLRKRTDFPIIGCDSDIGFRVQAAEYDEPREPGKAYAKRLFEMIADAKCPSQLFEDLREMKIQ